MGLTCARKNKTKKSHSSVPLVYCYVLNFFSKEYIQIFQEKMQHIVFTERYPTCIISTYFCRQGSSPFLWPLVRYQVWCRFTYEDGMSPFWTLKYSVGSLSREKKEGRERIRIRIPFNFHIFFME
jgi:hypothetical protein